MSIGEQAFIDPMEDWPEPDLSLIAGRFLKPPAFPVEIFGPARCWVEEAAAACNAPVDYIAGSLLATASALIGNTRKARAWGDYTQCPVLWIALVGRPSSKKTPAIKSVTDTVGEMERDARPDHEAALRAWEAKKITAEVAMGVWEEEVRNSANSNAPPPPMPENAVIPHRPTEPRRVINDITQEAMAVLLSESEARGLLLWNDELSGWFGSFDQYKSARGSDRAFWTRAYDAGTHHVDRKGSDPIYIPRLSVAVLGGIQPDHLTELMLRGPDDGVAARFLLMWPETVPPRRCDTPVDRVELRHALDRLNTLSWGRDMAGEPEPMVINLSSEAQDLFQDWQLGHHEESKATFGKMEGHYGKMDGFALRLSLVLEHVWWAWGQDRAEPHEISTKAMAAALGMIDRYVKPMAAACYADAALPPDEHSAAKLARWIKGNGMAEVNQRETYKGGPMKDAAEAGRALKLLGKAGIVREARKETGGAPRKDFAVNPTILDGR